MTHHEKLPVFQIDKVIYKLVLFNQGNAFTSQFILDEGRIYRNGKLRFKPAGNDNWFHHKNFEKLYKYGTFEGGEDKRKMDFYF